MSNEKFVVSCFFVLLIALLSLAMLVYDITNPSNSFTVIRFTTRPALFFLPTAFLSSQFARGSSTSLRTLSGLVVGSRKFQSRFFSSKQERSSETFKILKQSCLHFKVICFISCQWL